MKNLFSKSVLKNVFVALFFAIFLSMSVFIIYLSTENGSESTQTSNTVGEIVATAAESIGIVVDKESVSYKNFIRKAFGHFGLFFFASISAVLTILFLKKNPETRKIVIYGFLGYGLILAIITEIIQLYAGDRSGNFADVLIDLLGFIIPLGVLLVAIFYAYRKNRKDCKYIEV
ncbi:MAG: VanZ family protein [Bacilli bacterium]|nr:VanZ family protein [Bacilli bacterium]